MKLKVKKAHNPYPGIRLQPGGNTERKWGKIEIKPDDLARELIRRGFFVEDKPEEPKKKAADPGQGEPEKGKK